MFLFAQVEWNGGVCKTGQSPDEKMRYFVKGRTKKKCLVIPVIVSRG